jgi:alkylated DNA nucleotide flippase Atl1
VDACTNIIDELLLTFVAAVETGAVMAEREVASNAGAGAAWTVSTGVESGAGAVVLSCA